MSRAAALAAVAAPPTSLRPPTHTPPSPLHRTPCRPGLPMHLPQLLPAMQHYRWVLMTCHAGAELDVALEMAKGQLDDDLRCGAIWAGSGRDLGVRRRAPCRNTDAPRLQTTPNAHSRGSCTHTLNKEHPCATCPPPQVARLRPHGAPPRVVGARQVPRAAPPPRAARVGGRGARRAAAGHCAGELAAAAGGAHRQVGVGAFSSGGAWGAGLEGAEGRSGNWHVSLTMRRARPRPRVAGRACPPTTWSSCWPWCCTTPRSRCVAGPAPVRAPTGLWLPAC